MTDVALLIGSDIPATVVEAAGLRVERVVVAALPARLEAVPVPLCVVFSHLRSDFSRTYHFLLATRPDLELIFLDLPVGSGPGISQYTQQRLQEFGDRLSRLTGTEASTDRLRALRAKTDDVSDARSAVPSEGPAAVLAATSTGADATEAARQGYQVRWTEGEAGYGPSIRVAGTDPWAALSAEHEYRVRTVSRASMHARAAALIDAATGHGASHILLGDDDGDHPAHAWLCSILRRLAADTISVVDLRPLTETVADKPAAPGRPPETRPRAVKNLTVTGEFGDYQRSWFQGLRERVTGGEPFAVVNADTPQEVLRALDIPFVVNQWWASIAAAKGGTARSKAALRAAGLPDEQESYNSQGIAGLLAGENAAPWGGLPRRTVLQAMRSDAAIIGVFEEWSRLSGAELLLFDRTVESRPKFPVNWWDTLSNRWDVTLESSRLDLMTTQIADSIEALERATGRTLDRDRLQVVLDLVNEQEEWYRRTRDLIARTSPAPVSIVDTIPATMIPQWHRGTEWGRDAARAFHDEVAPRVESGATACAQERVRLLWVGRGPWRHMWLYQAFEKSHGAVFVWSMYLGLAADGYLRYAEPDQDPLRALAARFVTVGDELRMPTWAAAWHVAEAQRHGADAVIAIDDAEPFVLDELERAGYPVLRLQASNLAESPDGIAQDIEAFLDVHFGRTESLRE